MARKKYRGGGDTRGRGRGNGNGRGRGGGGSSSSGGRYLTHGQDFPENTPLQHRNFSLADEAKNTERHHGNFSGNALRHSKISFVAAGHLEPSDIFKPLNTDKLPPQIEELTKDSSSSSSSSSDEPMRSNNGGGGGGCDSPIEDSTGILPQAVNVGKLNLDPPEQKPSPFVVDIVGDPSLKPKNVKAHAPVRSPSPVRPGSSGSSTASEKIVFVPRAMRPGLSRTSSPVKFRSQNKLRTPSPRRPPPRAKSPVIQAKAVETTCTKALVPTIDDPVTSFTSFTSTTITTTTTQPTVAEDTPAPPNPFPSRSLGANSSPGRATLGNKRRRRRRNKKGLPDEDAAVIEDYIENVAATMRAELAEEAGESSTAAPADTDIADIFIADGKANCRALGTPDGEDDWSSTDSEDAAEDSDAVNALKAELWEEHEPADFDDMSTDSEALPAPVAKLLRKRVRPSGTQYLVKLEGYETEDATWVPAELLDSGVDDQIARYEVMLLERREDADSSDGSDNDEESADEDEDLKLARLLQRQEALGIADSDLELNLDLDDRFMELDPASFRRARKGTKKALRDPTFLPDITPNPRTGFFPSASRFADAYDGFDPMEWERPSLQKKGKGKKGKNIVVLDLSDSELEEGIRESWMKDREKKKAQKAEREALRAEGLLGAAKRGGKIDMKAKYKEGVTIDQLQSEIAAFLLSGHQSLALPPMDKATRKTVHNVALVFNLNSKSVGSGRKRFPTLYKTSRSAIFADEASIASVMARRRFFGRSDARGSGSGKSRGPGRGGAGGVVHHREGDIVGASAPELGVENRGRKMLEKMGYVTGMALGLEGREGIVKPVEAVVKISKAGLG